jgi:hypothetical protein
MTAQNLKYYSEQFRFLLSFFLASTLGAARVTASNFLSNYQSPFRLVSKALLVWAYYSASNSFVKNCKITFAGPNCLLSQSKNNEKSGVCLVLASLQFADSISHY